MSAQYVVTTRLPNDPVSRQWFGLDGDAASSHFRARYRSVRADGGTISIGFDVRVPDNRDRCGACAGTGTITTRYGGEGGCFPDEDRCPTCFGAGHLPTSHDNLPAKAA